MNDLERTVHADPAFIKKELQHHAKTNQKQLV